MVVLADQNHAGRRHKFIYRDTSLEVSYLWNDQLQSPNQVLSDYHLAPSFRTTSILPTEVSKQFGYLVSYYRASPDLLPDFFRYLLAYPREKPANAEGTFYWSKVKFGLTPTLRIVHLVTISDHTDAGPVWATAEKQLYSSHYFETALDLTFCIPDSNNQANQRGFYLIKVMGSEQAGLTGFKGSIVRNVAVGRSVSSLQKSLMAIKSSLEGHEEPSVHESPPQ